MNSGFSAVSRPASGQTASSRRTPQSQFGGATTMENLENTLNAVDNSKAWANTPITMAAPPRQQQFAPPASTNRGGLMPNVSRQEMLRIFMEGGTPQTTGNSYAQGPSSNSSANTQNAYNNYQTAENEASKARYAADRARYDKDKWNRKNAATQAEYAANNANYAAQRAESAAYTGDSQARSYANLARQAANRARENANRARYNADTMP